MAGNDTTDGAAAPAPSLADSIDQELAAAEAALVAEQAAAGQQQAPEPEPEPVATPATPPQAAPEPAPAPTPEPTAQQPPQMIPAPRFNEVIAERNEAVRLLREAQAQGGATRQETDTLRQQVAFLTGQLQAMSRTPPAPNGQSAPPQADPLAQIDAEIVALAERYEAGEISAVAFEKLRGPLLKKQAAAIAVQAVQMAAPRAPQQAQAATPTDDLYLQDQTRLMEEANPWLAHVPDSLVQGLKPYVMDWAKARGIPLTNDARGNRNLRAAFIAVGKEMRFPEIYGGVPMAPAAAGAPQATGVVAPVTIPKPPNQPPPIGTRGSGPGATAPGQLTAKMVEGMTYEEIMALPEHLLSTIAPLA